MRYLRDIPSFSINLFEMSPLANSAFNLCCQHKMQNGGIVPFDVCIDVTKRENTAYQFVSAMLEGEHGVNGVMSCEFDEYEKYRISGNHGLNQRTRGNYLPFLRLSDT